MVIDRRIGCAHDWIHPGAGNLNQGAGLIDSDQYCKTTGHLKVFAGKHHQVL